MSDHPITLELDDDLRRSRLTVFFRILLAIPLIIWLILWSIGVAIAAIAGWLAALVTGRLPGSLHRFFAAYVRFATHVGAYLGLAANPYPGFTGDPGYPVDVEIPAEPQPQPRWKIALRLFLAIPALLLAAILGSGAGGGGGSNQSPDSSAEWFGTAFGSTGVGGVAAVCAVLGWFAALATGRMPRGRLAGGGLVLEGVLADSQ